MRKFWSRAEIENCEENKPVTLQEAISSGDAVPLNVPPKPPEPDLSTKPKDIVGYCFGFACPKKHVQFTFESITVDDFKRRQACDTCGAVAKPAVVKRIAPPEWVASGKGMWRQYYLLNMGGSLAWEDKTKPRWSVYEFFHYLESPKRRKK